MPTDEPLATLTHARLRWAQGDAVGAERIVRRLLERSPGDAGADELLRRILDEPSAPAAPREEQAPLESPVSADPQRLRGRFRLTLGLGGETPAGRRIRRLSRWLEKITRSRSSG